MKQLFATIMVTLFLFATYLQSDQPVSNNQNNLINNFFDKELDPNAFTPNFGGYEKYEQPYTLFTPRVVDTIIYPGYISSDASFYQYDPISKTYAIILTPFKEVSGGSFRVLNLYTSQNDGVTWQVRRIENGSANLRFGPPSFAMYNTDNSTSSNLLHYFITTPVITDPNATRYNEGVRYYFFNSPDNNLIQKFDISGPYDRNPNGFLWFTYNASNIGYVNNNKLLFAHSGTLISPNTLMNINGMYAFASYQWDIEDFVVNTIPPQWDYTQFRTNETGASWNAKIQLGADDDGNLYALTNNMFKTDENRRNPAFSKSTDNGLTWTEFNKMPMNIIEDFIISKGGDPFDYAIMPGRFGYHSHGFIVHGLNHFSYIYPIISVKSMDEINVFIVELMYNNGTWSYQEVAELNSWAPYVLENADDAANPTRDVYKENDRGYEIQVSKADNGDMLVKWIDANLDLDPYTFSPINVNVFNSNTGQFDVQQLSEVIPTDIFMSWRPANGQWNNKVNLTNDRRMDFVTHIPPRIGTVEAIPLLISRNFPKQGVTNEQYPTFYRKNMPEPIWDLGMDIPHQILYSHLVNIKTSSVENNPTIADFKLNEPTPNPSIDIAQVSFSLDNSGIVELSIYDVLGQEVVQLLSEHKYSGYYAVDFDSSNLLSGTYYIRMSVNGKSISKMLNVVR